MSAPTLYASGTQVATSGSEHFLSSPNAAGVFTFHVDLVNMQAGDYTELRVYQIVLTSGSTRVAYLETFQGAQSSDAMIAISVPIGNDLTDTNSLRFSLKQTLGTGRSYPWKILSYL
jgi:hypothetical protein